jgi:hypothetical protein
MAEQPFSELPRPEDDGAADGIEGRAVPAVALDATTGERVDLAELARGTAVVYVYPATGVPGEPLPPAGRRRRARSAAPPRTARSATTRAGSRRSARPSSG